MNQKKDFMVSYRGGKEQRKGEKESITEDLDQPVLVLFCNLS